MTRRKWLWAALAAIPLAVGSGFAYANATKANGGYVCPATGESLPCEKCCPLNSNSPAPAEEAKIDGPVATAASKAERKTEGGYVCPLTGEVLGCKGCCPLNQDN